MSHIFISYSTNDAAFARHLRELLEMQGFEVWRDQENVKAGDKWWEKIEEAISSCSAFIVIVSPSARQSHWVGPEVLIAKNHEKKILPILIEGHPWSLLLNIHHEDMKLGLEAKLSPRFLNALDEVAPRRKPRVAFVGASPSARIPHLPLLDEKEDEVTTKPSIVALRQHLEKQQNDEPKASETKSGPEPAAPKRSRILVMIAVIVVVVVSTILGRTLQAMSDSSHLATETALAIAQLQTAETPRSTDLSTVTASPVTDTPSITPSFTTEPTLTWTSLPTFTATSTSTASSTPTSEPTSTATSTVTNTIEPSMTLTVPFLMESVSVTVEGSEGPTSIPVLIARLTGGCFEIGGTNQCLAAFQIDAHPVTNSDYIPCLEVGQCSLPSTEVYGNPDNSVVLVNWYMAQDYCEWRAARLPTEREWHYAAPYLQHDPNISEWVATRYDDVQYPYSPYNAEDGREVVAVLNPLLDNVPMVIRQFDINEAALVHRHYGLAQSGANRFIGFRCVSAVSR
jgi:formylglycine-generating enzyme required for sulfatase activity